MADGAGCERNRPERDRLEAGRPAIGQLDLDRIVFVGRTFAEYEAMFGLDEELLGRGPVLDCGAGPSSFAAEAHGRGIAVTACDPLYGLAAETLSRKGRDDIDHVFDQFDRVSHRYVWNFYRDKKQVISLRGRALAKFAEDFPAGRGQGRYVTAELPRLPFADGSFRLVLCSHFLFLYNDRLSQEFHRASLRELMRVSSGEVRIFPLQGLDGQPYEATDELLEELRREGVDAEIVTVPFEFQRGSNQFLRLNRRG